VKLTRRFLLAFVLLGADARAGQPASENALRFCLRAEPKTFHPALVTDEASETIRYLTGGVLIRLNRDTQQPEPELAVSWNVLDGGRRIRLRLRQGVRFSDGTPFTAADVAYTMRVLLDPKLNSPTGDSFRSGKGTATAAVEGSDTVTIVFPAPVAGLVRLFDQVAILSEKSPAKERAVLGPFYVAEHTPGAHILLKRNRHYWKTDDRGRRLPYLDAVRLEILPNEQLELLRFSRGDLHLINRIAPEHFERLSARSPHLVHDAGPSLENELLWFNQVSRTPIPDHRKAWFRSKNFRRAVSALIRRDDICRLVYRGHAIPAVGIFPPANRFWFNAKLRPHAYDYQGALRRLEENGFRLRDGVLRDAGGRPVEFSLITNAGNPSRERMAAMIQDDLAKAGVKVNIVTLDFPSLIERITRTFQYEACLLGFVNVDLDPNGQMNVWLSSAANHQWNPSQPAPETAWEAEIDRLMLEQAGAPDERRRKAAFDRVQEIVWEEAPFIYLVNKNSLSAAVPGLRGLRPVILRPQTYWNIEWLSLDTSLAGGPR